ncbi:MAG: hypothetical protein ACI9G1_002967, partial [Pirellulaceae bacterium]
AIVVKFLASSGNVFEFDFLIGFEAMGEEVVRHAKPAL